MNREIERLVKLSVEAESYISDRVRTMAKRQLQATANQLGYSFASWQETGVWVRFADLETELKPVSKPIKTVETIVEPKRIETVKKPSIRKETVILLETETENETEKVCEFCKNRFVSKRSVKRFCTDKCKRDFNNFKRRNNELMANI